MAKYNTELPYYQQGDVLIKPILMGDDAFYSNWRLSGVEKRETEELTELVLAYGESSGHSHKLTAVKGKIIHYIPRNSRENIVLEVTEDATLTHEEHGPFTIPAGTYIIEAVQEVDHFSDEVRAVAD